MNSTGIESIDHSVQLARLWIKELDALAGWENTSRTYRLLRAVLQAVRDWLPPDEAADLGAQLPVLLRGVYYEHWRPAATPVKQRDKASFIGRIDRSFALDPLGDSAESVSLVFRFLARKISSGEIEHVRHDLPSDLRALWPANLAAQ